MSERTGQEEARARRGRPPNDPPSLDQQLVMLAVEALDGSPDNDIDAAMPAFYRLIERRTDTRGKAQIFRHGAAALLRQARMTLRPFTAKGRDEIDAEAQAAFDKGLDNFAAVVAGRTQYKSVYDWPVPRIGKALGDCVMNDVEWLRAYRRGRIAFERAHLTHVADNIYERMRAHPQADTVTVREAVPEADLELWFDRAKQDSNLN